ncbi:hypothetical protein HMI54_012320, partial [Coelomomyces lativittatus]
MLTHPKNTFVTVFFSWKKFSHHVLFYKNKKQFMSILDRVQQSHGHFQPQTVDPTHVKPKKPPRFTLTPPSSNATSTSTSDSSASRASSASSVHSTQIPPPDLLPSTPSSSVWSGSNALCPQKLVKLGLLGPANAGKSTLVNLCVGQWVSMVSSRAQTTRQPLIGIHSHSPYQVVFLDTPGVVPTPFTKKVAREVVTSPWTTLPSIDHLVILLDSAKLAYHQLQWGMIEKYLFHRLSTSPEYAHVYPHRTTLLFNKIDLLPWSKIQTQLHQFQQKLKQPPNASSSFVLPSLKYFKKETERMHAIHEEEEKK